MIDTGNLKALALALAVTCVAACGGGGGGGGDIAGIDGTGSPATPTVSLGTITAFGSVYVNGVRFNTDDSSFLIDGQPGTQSDLAIGDVVLVTGSLDSGSTVSGTADTIVFDDAVEGPVQSVDLAGGTLVVLGQRVHVTADTAFDNSFADPSLNGIAVGDIVEVSGLRSSDGSIEATRIEPKTGSITFETTGLVADLDDVAMTFTIGSLVVDYSTAAFQDFGGALIANGDLVEVKGSSLGAAGELLASSVELKSGQISSRAGDRVEVEGYVTRFVDSTDFSVAGVRVTTTSNTRYEGGSPADLGLDIKVEAEGSVDSSGVLVATKIDIRRSAAVRMVALVDSVDTASSSFVVLGITVKADALTRLEDKSDQRVESFGIDDLAAGDYVEVRGTEFPAGSGDVLAALIERDDPDTDTELQGFVETVAQPSFEILGVTITTNAGTQFRSAGNASISQSQFFGQLGVGSLVKVDGSEVANRAIVAAEAEFEIQ